MVAQMVVTVADCDVEGHAAELWLRRQVQIGLDSANVGNLIPAAEVEAEFAAKRAATRRRLEPSAKWPAAIVQCAQHQGRVS
jgi:hypothetical protein